MTFVFPYPKPDPGKGALYGKQWQPRDLARIHYEAGFTDAMDLVVMLCVCLSESQGYDYAINVNKPNKNGIIYEDRGIDQLSSQHAEITDEEAYDPPLAAEAAFVLYKARKRAGQSGFEDWYGFLNGIYLHDTYLQRAVIGVANFMGETLLSEPVPDISADTAYVHRLTTPIADYHHRVAEQLAHLDRGRSMLGWGARTKEQVAAVQAELAKGHTAAKASLPTT